MGRYECVRCHVTCFTTDGEHICKDVLARLKRREKQRDAVLAILTNEGMVPYGGAPVENVHVTLTRVSEGIVAKLAQMGVTED